MTKEKQKAEAVERMNQLGMSPEIIKEFEDGILNQSESEGFLYFLDSEEQARVDKFEEKYGCLVYHVIHDYSWFGELLTLMYVSADEEEWEEDRKMLEDGEAYAYVINLEEEWLSEFGCVCIEPSDGGLYRTA